MSADKRGMHGIWGNRWTFILAATGSAVGLGNIWKFPYMAGENGGGAFVLMYLLCILSVGIPVMMAEVLLGRKGRMSPINTMREMTNKENAPHAFRGIGWMGAVAGFFILSFYSVIAGWTLAYVGKMASGEFSSATAEVTGDVFGQLLSDPWMLTGLHTIFILMTGAVIARGVKHGLENSVRILMPLLFVMLVLLLGYSMTTPGFSQGWSFLFNFQTEALTSDALVSALGHSFFTLSLGMGAIMAYGAYMPANASLGKTILAVGVLDTLVALTAGLVIFPIVFSYGLEPDSGPGLLFQTLPIAFGNMPGGAMIGTLFFLLVLIAAWSSAISIAEPAVAWAVERGWGRLRSTIIVCGFAWLLGLGTVMSFSDWSGKQIFVTETVSHAVNAELVAEEEAATEAEVVSTKFHWYADVNELKAAAAEGFVVKTEGKTFFNVLDFLTTNLMMPLGGLLIAIFVGWFMTRESVAAEARVKSPVLFNIWRFMVRYISPVAIFFIFIEGLS